MCFRIRHRRRHPDLQRRWQRTVNGTSIAITPPPTNVTGRHVAFAILVAAIGLLTALCVSLTDAQAAIRIEGTPYSVQIEASDAPLGAIFDMLADKFGVRVDSPTELTDRIDGIYSGPLRVVIGRLLDSYNYVIIIGDKASDTSMRVVLFGRITAAAVSAPAVQSRPDTPASRWRTPPGGR